MTVVELETLESQLRRDLAPFADPESEIIVTQTRTALSTEWSQGNRLRRAGFRRHGTDIIVTESGSESRYRAFFAGPSMADLDALAQGTRRLHRSSQPFVEGRARTLDEFEAAHEARALLVVSGAIGEPSSSGATRMVFVRADAGVGKTTTLRRLCYTSAEQVLARRGRSILLFIDAQGRGLRRLDEAIAVALDDLRHPLTYHAVPTLTRLGLLVPVIDGFDELIGASGTFDAAFDSLSSFVERLEGQGVFVASARSAYYEREFVTRVDREANRDAVAWHEVAVELLPWDESEVDEYLRLHEPEFRAQGITLAEMRDSVRDLFEGPNAALRGKPFFVSRAVDLLLSGSSPDAESDRDLLGVLVAEYLRREAEQKLLTPESAEPVASAADLADLLAEVASVMWTLETRELEPEDVEEVADLFAELWELPAGSARLLREKSTSLAFLVRSPSQRISFEHPLFFGFFLASRFPRVLAEGERAAGELASLLGRSALPEGSAPAIAQALLGGRGDEEDFGRRVGRVFTALSRAVGSSPGDLPRTRENAGHLGTYCRFRGSVHRPGRGGQRSLSDSIASAMTASCEW